MSDADAFHRHHWTSHDWCAVAAPSHLARPVLGPEGVNNLRTFVAVILALLAWDGQWVEVAGHHLLAGQMRPGSLLAVRTVAVVVGHDLRLDLSLDIGEQVFDLVQVDIG